jgi:salicylate hydroxylase
MLKDFSGWGPQVHSILSLMKKTDIWALFSHPPAPTYYRGRACLLGDAAHASTPHQGAGAGMGIEDALVMQHLLGCIDEKSEIELAFASFDRIRRERTQKLVVTSLEAGKLYDFEKDGAMDNISKIRDELSVRMKWIWDFDLNQHLKDSSAILTSLMSEKPVSG